MNMVNKHMTINGSGNLETTKNRMTDPRRKKRDLSLTAQHASEISEKQLRSEPQKTAIAQRPQRATLVK